METKTTEPEVFTFNSLSKTAHGNSSLPYVERKETLSLALDRLMQPVTVYWSLIVVTNSYQIQCGVILLDTSKQP